MPDRYGLPLLGQVRPDLYDAADVSGSHCLRTSFHDASDFSLAQTTSHLGLLDIIQPSRTAAKVGFGDREQDKVGYHSQQATRSLHDALRVSQVAGIMIGQLQRLG